MKNGLWGHALLLASKMDSRTHARVMTRFANSLPINDPLQTVYQLMSGRMPAASTVSGLAPGLPRPRFLGGAGSWKSFHHRMSPTFLSCLCFSCAR